jgi:hypothetical protein
MKNLIFILVLCSLLYYVSKNPSARIQAQETSAQEETNHPGAHEGFLAE